MKLRSGLVELPVATADGEFLAGYSEKGLAELSFPKSNHRRRDDESQLSLPSGDLMGDASRRRLPLQIRRWHSVTIKALKAILAGREPKEFPPFDLKGTAFQKSVWHQMRRIPLGKTRSYGEIAQAIGRPKAVRAVGGACGANPVPVLVPCHRVLAANKKLGGFGGGLDWKRRLLAREGISFLAPLHGNFKGQ